MSLDLLIFFFFFFKYHLHFFFFTDVDNIYMYLILKESKSVNHFIFCDYLTAMKIVVPENFDFQ